MRYSKEKFLKQLAISILGGAAFWVILQIGGVVWRSGPGVISSFIDEFYRRAAASDGLELVRMVALITLFVAAAACLGFMLATIKTNIDRVRMIKNKLYVHEDVGCIAVSEVEQKGEITRDINDLEVQCKQGIDEIVVNIDEIVVKLENVMNKLEDIEKDAERQHQDELRKKRKEIVRFVLGIFSIAFLLVYLYVFYHAPNSTRRAFEVNLTILTPHVEQEVVDTLRSQWVSMQSREDHQRIVDRFNEEFELINERIKYENEE